MVEVSVSVRRELGLGYRLTVKIRPINPNSNKYKKFGCVKVAGNFIEPEQKGIIS